MTEEISHLRLENEKLAAKNRSMARQIEELRTIRTMADEEIQLQPRMNQLTLELSHAKEALSGNLYEWLQRHVPVVS